MVAIKQGGMMYHPAGLHHYDGAKDEDVIDADLWPGPVQTVQTEVDASGQPVRAAAAPAVRALRTSLLPPRVARSIVKGADRPAPSLCPPSEICPPSL